MWCSGGIKINVYININYHFEIHGGQYVVKFRIFVFYLSIIFLHSAMLISVNVLFVLCMSNPF